MKRKIALLTLIPIILFADIYSFSFITEFLSLKSDVGVVAGLLSLVGYIFGNTFIIYGMIKYFKK